MTPEKQTEIAFRAFNRLDNSQLAELLNTAGVVPCKSRCLMLHQALIVWFHGNIPSLQALIHCTNQYTSSVMGAAQ